MKIEREVKIMETRAEKIVRLAFEMLHLNNKDNRTEEEEKRLQEGIRELRELRH